MEIDASVSMSDLALSCRCMICGTRLALFIWTDASFGHTCSVWNRTGLVICSAESCMELASEGWPAIVCGKLACVILKISAQNLLLWDSSFWKLLDLCSALSVVTSLAALVAILYLLLQCLHSDFPLCIFVGSAESHSLWSFAVNCAQPPGAMAVKWFVNLMHSILRNACEESCDHWICVCVVVKLEAMPALRDVVLRYVCHAWTSRYKAWKPEPHPRLAHVCFFFICCLRFDQVLKNLLAVPWHGSLEQCISLFVKHCFHCCQNLEQKLNFCAIEFCIQVFADNYASQDFAVRSSTYPAGRV